MKEYRAVKNESFSGSFFAALFLLVIYRKLTCILSNRDRTVRTASDMMISDGKRLPKGGNKIVRNYIKKHL